MRTAIQELGENKVKDLVLHHANNKNVTDVENLLSVLNACFLYNDLCPQYTAKRKLLSSEEKIEKWVDSFATGYAGRISQHISNMPNTLPDKAISIILKARLPHLSNSDCEKIIYAHRLSMSIENIQGLFLEEYLSLKMRSFGWYMAWGATIVAADMCSTSGELLQIKNQSNTENSSSNKIRVGTEIHKWYRRKATTGETMWDALCSIIRCPSDYMTEEDYQAFIRNAIENNPSALPVETNNPWRCTL